MDPDTVAKAFVEHYYNLFDMNRVGLAMQTSHHHPLRRTACSQVQPDVPSDANATGKLLCVQ
ncbi:hypothetical protein OIU78_013400 [Salix suchowensis]|nr:hypothetical protein OIU78_013400 [Salix suchowensis]